MSLLAADSWSDKVNISGFGRVVGGYLDTNSANFAGYEDSISLDEESLIGVQADVDLTDTLSVTAQLLGHTGDSRRSGIEWLYLTYRPTANLQLRLGKQRTNIYSYSNVLDVGFAYPWITPPKGIYNSFLLPSYEGINLQYSKSFAGTVFTAEGYWGSDDTELVVNRERFQPFLNDLRGLILSFRAEKLSGRVSVNTGDIRISIPAVEGFQTILNNAGFAESAATLSSDGPIRLYHGGLKYEELNWFVEAEFNRVSTDILTIPNIRGLALTGVYNWYPFSLFATFSKFENERSKPASDIPVGISPDIDALAFGYNQLFQTLPIDDANFYTLGLRHDLTSSMAVKVSATYIDGDKNARSFFSFQDNDFDRQAILYQAALEWVF